MIYSARVNQKREGGFHDYTCEKNFFLHKTMLWLRILTCHRRHLQQHRWQLGSCSSWILCRTFHIYRDKSSPHHHWDEFCHLSRRGEASILHPWLILLNCRQYVVFEVAENLKKLPLNIFMQFIVSLFQWMELNGLDFSDEMMPLIMLQWSWAWWFERRFLLNLHRLCLQKGLTACQKKVNFEFIEDETTTTWY